jgi:hypothetical protein
MDDRQDERALDDLADAMADLLVAVWLAEQEVRNGKDQIQ